MEYFVNQISHYENLIKKIKDPNDKANKGTALYVYGEIKFDMGLLLSRQNEEINEKDKHIIFTRFMEMLNELTEILLRN